MREQRWLKALAVGLTNYMSRRFRRWQLLGIVAGLTFGLVLLG